MNYFKKSSFWFCQFSTYVCGGFRKVRSKFFELETQKTTKNVLDSNQCSVKGILFLTRQNQHANPQNIFISFKFDFSRYQIFI